MIEVTFRTILHLVPLAGNHKKQIVRLVENSDAGFLLNRLIETYGDELKNALFDENMNIRKGITMYKNGVSILALEELDTVLYDGDDFLVFPPVGGG